MRFVRVKRQKSVLNAEIRIDILTDRENIPVYFNEMERGRSDGETNCTVL